MEVLNPLHNPLSDLTLARLLASLQDIAQHVQIEPNFCIRHPSYQPLETPVEVTERFQRLPMELQHKYLSLQLRSFLYGIYYNGSLRETLAPNAHADTLKLSQNLENNTFLGVDLAFYERLHLSNCGQGYFDPEWQVLRQERDGSLVVNKRGLTLHIERDRHLSPESKTATIGDFVAIRLPCNRVQNGFYVAVGNLIKQQPVIVRIYFNLTPAGAIAVMASLTRHLNDNAVPFDFKVLYNPSDYNRYDSGVLYFEKSDYESVRSMLQGIYIEHRADFKEQIPLFTKQLAPGLGLAEEPDQKFSDYESFGLNRCQVIANGLLEAWQQGNDSPDSRMASILQHFSLMGLELQRCYLNANSEDIYTPLDL
jgi:hypothetical protein